MPPVTINSHSPVILPTTALIIIVSLIIDVSLGHFILTLFPSGIIIAFVLLSIDHLTVSLKSTFKIFEPPIRIVGDPV